MSDNKDIDKLFQQGSEKYDFEYNPVAWANMEKKLNSDEHNRHFWWWFFGGIGVFLVVGVVGLARFKSSDYKSSSNPKQQEVVRITAESAKEENSQPIENSQNIGLIPEIKDTNFDSVEIQNGQLEQVVNSSIESIESKKRVLSQKKNDDQAAVLGKTVDKVSSFVAQPIHDVLSEKIVGAKSDLKSNKIASNKKRDKLSLLPILLPKALIVAKPSDSELMAPLIDRLFTQKSKVSNQFLIGVYLASEMSSVNFESISKNSLRFGGQLNYRFKKKFGTSIGVSYIRKKYNVGEGAYSPPKGFWTRKIAPKTTEATCKILEIPISLVFFPKGYEQNGLYSSVGMSSYFMLNERYLYSYHLSDPDLIRQWGTKGENNHWFGIGQFSIGYQKYISQKASIQCGPYLHVPFTGVGHGQVKLWSFGLEWKMNFLAH